jgi:hypothetical protein
MYTYGGILKKKKYIVIQANRRSVGTGKIPLSKSKDSKSKEKGVEKS